MSSMEIIPGLVLDDIDYELAAAGVAEYAPHLAPLTRERFLDPTGWRNIPNLSGEISRSELTLLTGVDATVKLNRWVRPDIRGGDEDQIPHNHRWDIFYGHLLRGAYSEVRFRRADIDPETGHAEVIFEPRITHASPGINAVPHDVWHEVVAVDPGTLSLMVCGRGEFGNWSHLDVDSGQLIHEQPVKEFDAMFAALNPHCRGQL